jgi:hypothetical protein
MVYLVRSDAQIANDISTGVLTPLQGMVAYEAAHYGWYLLDVQGDYGGAPAFAFYTDKGDPGWATVQTMYGLPSHNTGKGNAGVLANMALPLSYVKAYMHSFKRCVITSSC